MPCSAVGRWVTGSPPLQASVICRSGDEARLIGDLISDDRADSMRGSPVKQGVGGEGGGHGRCQIIRSANVTAGPSQPSGIGGSSGGCGGSEGAETGPGASLRRHSAACSRFAWAEHPDVSRRRGQVPVT